MFITSFRINGALVAVFGVLTVTFIALTIGDLGASTGATKAGGYLGILTAALAWYTGFAGVMNNTAGKPVLPVFPMKK
jgi:succinate-acetate transporter protein